MFVPDAALRSTHRCDAIVAKQQGIGQMKLILEGY